MLYNMGWETANVHLGSATAETLLADLAKRHKHWLAGAVEIMRDAVKQDWKTWRKKDKAVAAGA